MALPENEIISSKDANGPDLIGLCQKLYVRGLYVFEKLILFALLVLGFFLIIAGSSRFSFADPINVGQAAGAVGALVESGDPSQLGEVLKGIAAEEKAADEERDLGLFGQGAEQSVDYREIKCGTGLLFQLLNGNLGGFLMIGATIAALISTWSGRYYMTFSILIFLAGALILRPATEIFFFTDYSDVPDLIPTDANCD